MKQVFAGSMIEGAPFGNKNAAGKHGGVSQEFIGRIPVGVTLKILLLLHV